MAIGPELVRANSAVRKLLQEEVRLSEDAARFWEVLLGTDPIAKEQSVVLFRRIGWKQPTLTSRLQRCALPTVTRCRTALIAVYAAALFELDGQSVSHVAYRLGFASPQSYSRHTRLHWRVSPCRFRETLSLADTLHWMRYEILHLNAAEWSTFTYLGPELIRRANERTPMPAHIQITPAPSTTRTVTA